MTQPARTARDVTWRRVSAIALPVVLSNATVPLQGAVDTAIIGNLGDAVYLAAVALGAGAISLLLGLFNFLQFGAGALSAQALGAGDNRRVINVLARALILAATIALALIALKWLLIPLTMRLYEGSARAEELASVYLHIRVWGAPAELGVFALTGWFSGQEMTRRLFELQIVISLTNIALNVVFVIGLGMDVDGVALGTLIASYLGFGYGLWRVRRRMAVLLPGWRPERHRLLNPVELRALFRLNRDIFIRSMLLIGAFTYTTRLGSLQGDLMLAANGILLQLFSLASYGLDGFAIAAESLVGQAVGRRDRAFLRRAVVVCSLSALVLASVAAAVLFLVETPLIALFTNIEAVRALTAQHYFWAALLPVMGVLAFLMDGVFVGATAGAAMRNAMIMAAGLYFGFGGWMADHWGNHGVWAGVWIFLILRGVTLLVQYPALERRAGISEAS